MFHHPVGLVLELVAHDEVLILEEWADGPEDELSGAKVVVDKVLQSVIWADIFHGFKVVVWILDGTENWQDPLVSELYINAIILDILKQSKKVLR